MAEPKTPISPKVVAATAGAGGGAILSQFILWLIGAGLFHGGWGAGSVDTALASVPAPVSGLVMLIVIVVSAAVPGYQTDDPLRHVHADPEPEPEPPQYPGDPT